MSKIVTASKLNRLWKNGVLPIKDKVDDKLSSYNDVMANNVEGYIPDALAIKEGFDRLGGLRFGVDGDGNYGYYGADGSLIPFSSGGAAGSGLIYLGNIQSYGTHTIDLSEYNISDVSGMELLATNVEANFARDGGATYYYSLDLSIDSYINNILTYTVNTHPLQSEQSFYLTSHRLDIYLVNTNASFASGGVIDLGVINSYGTHTIDLSEYNISKMSDMKLLATDIEANFVRDGGVTAYNYSLELSLDSYDNNILTYTVNTHPLQSEQLFYINSHSARLYLVNKNVNGGHVCIPKKELLWSNSSMTDTTSISLNLSDYKYVIIGTIYSTTYSSHIVYNHIEVGGSGFCVVNNGGTSSTGACNSRQANVTTTGITFTNISASGRCIPVEVYGVKGGSAGGGEGFSKRVTLDGQKGEIDLGFVPSSFMVFHEYVSGRDYRGIYIYDTYYSTPVNYNLAEGNGNIWNVVLSGTIIKINNVGGYMGSGNATVIVSATP